MGGAGDANRDEQPAAGSLEGMPFPEKKATLLDPELVFLFCEWLQLWVAVHRC